MRKYLFLSLLFICSLYPEPGNSFPIESDDYYANGNKAINKVYDEYVRRIVNKYDLTCTGSIGGFPHKIESLGGMFAVYRMIDVDELRVLILSLLSDFQKMINESEEIRPYLAEYPYPSDRITIMINVYDGDKRVPPDEISFAFSCRHRIFYTASDPKKSYSEQREIEETLEEASAKAYIDVATIMPIHSLYDGHEHLLVPKDDKGTTPQK